VTDTPTHHAANDPSAEERRRRNPRGRLDRLPTYVKHRRRHEGESVTRSAAIQAHCRECVGWDSGGLGSVAEAVRQCPSSGCWLWPYRNGALHREGG
jgi:hypothetical protein